MALSSRQQAALRTITEGLADCGASLRVEAPGLAALEIGARPAAARVCFREPTALEALLRRDHLALAEAYLEGRVDIEGEMAQVMQVTELLELEASRFDKLRFALSFALRDRRRWNRESISFHYDRPPEFFLPWLDRWRSYSHGLYASADDDVSEAQARKMQHAIDALGLRPGMRVFDMGGGWGCFLEYAGRQGIRVESITISEEQYRFCDALIQDLELPCSIEKVDFIDHRPREPYDAAVFMGTLEHMPDYPRVARFLGAHLKPEGRFYTDFCAQRESFLVGDFMRKYIWPGTATYVDLPRLLGALVREGFNVWELADDTLSYACTVRDWALRMEAVREDLAAKWGESSVRAFLLYLWGSYHFLSRNRTQAYHLVAGRQPVPVD